MEKLNLKDGFYVLCEMSNQCCDTLKKWESDPEIYRFENEQERDEFAESWMCDNYDAESTPRVKVFEVSK